MCAEKKSLRHIMYAAARSPKPRVSVHLVFNCYKLSHLTPSSLPCTTGLEQFLHTERPESKLRSHIRFWNTHKLDPYCYKNVYDTDPSWSTDVIQCSLCIHREPIRAYIRMSTFTHIKKCTKCNEEKSSSKCPLCIFLQLMCVCVCVLCNCVSVNRCMGLWCKIFLTGWNFTLVALKSNHWITTFKYNLQFHTHAHTHTETHAHKYTQSSTCSRI